MQWTEPEWWDPADEVYDEAYAASDEGYLTECEVTHCETEGWFWIVKATSNLSEWPEVQDCGSCGSKREGILRCEQVVAAVLDHRT